MLWPQHLQTWLKLFKPHTSFPAYKKQTVTFVRRRTEMLEWYLSPARGGDRPLYHTPPRQITILFVKAKRPKLRKWQSFVETGSHCVYREREREGTLWDVGPSGLPDYTVLSCHVCSYWPSKLDLITFCFICFFSSSRPCQTTEPLEELTH